VGLWLAGWQRVPITFPNGGTLSQIIDWSADGERLLLSAYYTDSGATGPFFAYFTPATGELTPLTAGSQPTLTNIPFAPVWDQEHQAIVYLQYRGLLTSTSVYAPVADIIAIDETGRIVREFTPVLLTHRELAAQLVREGHPEVAEYPTSNDVSVSRNGRVSILKSDKIVTMRVGEADQTITLPLTVTERMKTAPPFARVQAGLPPELQLWVAPNAEYYALAITRTLAIYQRREDIPLHEFFSTCGGELAHNSYAQYFEWSPNNEAFYFQFVSLDTLERLCNTYIQRLHDSELHHLTEYRILPSIPGGSSWPSGITWQANGPWIVIARNPERQCGGRPPFGCVLSQTLLDRYGMQTPVIWWSSNTEGGDSIWLGGPSAWSPTSRRFAAPCTRNLWTAQTDTSESAICLLDFSWEQPETDPCEKPLAPNLRCGKPDLQNP